jgi:hypothetical protein
VIRSVKHCGAKAQLDCGGPSERGDLDDGDGGDKHWNHAPFGFPDERVDRLS